MVMTITKPDWSVPLLLEHPIAAATRDLGFKSVSRSQVADSASSKRSRRVVVSGRISQNEGQSPLRPTRWRALARVASHGGIQK